MALKKPPHPEEPPEGASRRTHHSHSSRGGAQDKRVCVGAVGAAHGVRGAVRIKSFTAKPEDIARYGPLEDESGERHFTLRITGAAKGVLIAKLSGVADRDRAEALRGLRLYLPRAALPLPVRAVHDFGAGDTLEIVRPEGPPAMVPFTKAIVPEIDLAAGRLLLDPPPGLLDALRNLTNRRHPRGSGGRGAAAPAQAALDTRFRGNDEKDVEA